MPASSSLPPQSKRFVWVYTASPAAISTIGCCGIALTVGGRGAEGIGPAGHGPWNDPTIGSYNYYHLSPNGIPRGNQRWYGLVYLYK